MPETIDHDPKALPPRRARIPRSAIVASALVGVLIAGAALGAGGTRLAQNWEPQRVMLLQTSSIDALRENNVAAVKGEVTDVFGNKFVLQDDSGRALVDLGPRGEDRPVVAKGDTVSVQGRFDRGIVRAQVLTRADGTSVAFGPPGPKGPKQMKGPKGPKEAKGPPPDADDDRLPPPQRAGGDAPPPPPADRAERHSLPPVGAAQQ